MGKNKKRDHGRDKAKARRKRSFTIKKYTDRDYNWGKFSLAFMGLCVVGLCLLLYFL